MCAMLTITSACTAPWVTTLDAVLTTAGPALVNILQIVAIANGQPMNAGLAAKIAADVVILKTLATDFANASATAAPGVCSQMQAALGVYQAFSRSLSHLVFAFRAFGPFPS
jgi:hypothetical protein